MPKGGKRPGAGAKPKYGEKTKVIRVPESKVVAIKELLSAENRPASGDIEILTPQMQRKLSLPMMGSAVSAGFPSPAEDYIETALDLNEHLIQHPAATFYARLGKTSDSMVGAGIYPGDIIIVDRSLDAKHGDIVLAVVNSEFTLKRYHKRDGETYLQAENPKYPPITFQEGDEMQIWGVVKHSIRNF